MQRLVSLPLYKGDRLLFVASGSAGATVQGGPVALAAPAGLALRRAGGAVARPRQRVRLSDGAAMPQPGTKDLPPTVTCGYLTWTMGVPPRGQRGQATFRGFWGGRGDGPGGPVALAGLPALALSREGGAVARPRQRVRLSDGPAMPQPGTNDLPPTVTCGYLSWTMGVPPRAGASSRIWGYYSRRGGGGEGAGAELGGGFGQFRFQAGRGVVRRDRRRQAFRE